MNQRSFRRKSETLDGMHQMALDEVFNESELLRDDSKEPKITVFGHTCQAKTKREDNFEGLSIIPQTFLVDEHHGKLDDPGIRTALLHPL